MSSELSRRSVLALSTAGAAVVAAPGGVAHATKTTDDASSARSDSSSQIALLTDPFLQLPRNSTVRVAWFTEFRGDAHLVVTGPTAADLDVDKVRAALVGVDRSRRRRGHVAARLTRHLEKVGLCVHEATTSKLSRTAEDAESKLPADRLPAQGVISPRPVFRHSATVTGAPRDGHPLPYRVISVAGENVALSKTFGLRGELRRGQDAVIMLTSDHQAMINTPANVQFAKDTITEQLGPISAVIFAGDLVNVPDRASEWFDDTRGSAFFPVLQGLGGREGTDGVTYRGADVIQHAPIFPAIGNHEVQGRIDGAASLGRSFNAPVPRDVAAREYEKVAHEVNPTGSRLVKKRWIENNSFSTTTYEEIFELPGNERYYAVTLGDVRLVVLYSTRIWRGTDAEPDPTKRTTTSRYQESAATLDAPLEQGYGEFIFEDIAAGSTQYEWLVTETRSAAFRRARYRIVMLHEGPQGLGDNVMPQFAHPVRIEEKDEAGRLVGVRYEYPAEKNVALHDLGTLLEASGVNLVYYGHSHLWNRFHSESAATGETHYLEASNTGNSYGAFHPVSGRSRPLPPAPWTAENYLAQGNPGGLDAEMPTLAPLTNEAGEKQPFIASNDYCVFQALHTGTGTVTSWYVDMRNTAAGAVKFDEFTLGE